jgi:single-strand DNA-binding protein
MYALKNKVQLIGNLGNIPEVNYTDDGRKWVRFSIATNETYYNNKGVKVTETQWHTLVAWGKLADLVQRYLNIGRQIVVEGKLVNRNYYDKTGSRRYITEIVVNELLILGANMT